MMRGNPACKMSKQEHTSIFLHQLPKSFEECFNCGTLAQRQTLGLDKSTFRNEGTLSPSFKGAFMDFCLFQRCTFHVFTPSSHLLPLAPHPRLQPTPDTYNCVLKVAPMPKLLSGALQPSVSFALKVLFHSLKCTLSSHFPLRGQH